MIPMFFAGGLVPSYILIAKWLHLKDSIFSMIIPLGINLWYLLIIKSFFDKIPASVRESAMIDGARDMVVFFKIYVPMSIPALITFTLFYGVDRWNEWYNCMLYISSTEKYTLQYLLRQMVINASNQRVMEYAYEGKHMFMVGVKMAAVILAITPIAVVYPFLQRYFVYGIAIGAVKE